MSPLLAIVIIVGLMGVVIFLRLKWQREKAALEHAAHESELRRIALLEGAFDCIVTLDHDGKIVEFNPAAEKTFGCKRATVLNRPLSEMIMPTPFGQIDAASFLKYFTDDHGKMLGKRQEMMAVRANGAEFPVELMISQSRARDKDVFTVYIREITERIKGETALFERANLAALNVEINRALASTGTMRSVLQNCAEAIYWHIGVALARIWTADERGLSLELLASAGFDTGLAAEQSRFSFESSQIGRAAREGRPDLVNDLVPEDFEERDRVWIARENITAYAVYPMYVENRMVGVVAVFDRKPLPEGLITSLAAVAEGITQFIERTHAEEHVREQAALLDKATDAIVVRDLTGIIRFWSKGAEKVYGWSPAEAVGHNVSQLLAEKGVTPPYEVQQKTLEDGEWSGEFTVRTKDGREAITESRWTLVRDENGKAKSILVIASDVTEKKQLEKKFLRAQRLEVIGTLAGGIAHDFNNMLGPIMIVSQLLRKDLQDEKSLGRLALMERNALRGAGMVKQILAFARGMAGEQGALQIHHLIGDVYRIAQDTFPSSIHIDASAPKDLWTIEGDATQLHQVLLNLSINARDAMPDGGALRLEARNVVLGEEQLRAHPDWKPGRYVSVAVADTGTGIPAENLEKIFDPFFTTKEPGKGTGLGLSTVKSIVKGHGGYLEVVSSVGQGTTFMIYFPAMQTGEMETAESHPVQMLTGNGEQILLVDDELAIRELTKATLEDFGYKVHTGHDGAEAVGLFAKHHRVIDVVVIDMTMPVMDGPSAIHLLREINPSIKVVAISGVAIPEEIERMTKFPNTVFLAKPYNADQLLKTLRSVLTRAN